LTATPDNLRITKLNKTNGKTLQVIIGLTRATENWTKSLVLITPPKGDSNQSVEDGKNPTKFVDLLMKAEQRLTFDGYISDSMRTRIELPTYPSGRYGSVDKDGNAITDATDILDTMREIFFGGGTFDIVWVGTTYSVNSDKFEATWVTNDKDTITSYDVKFTVIVGGDY